MNSAKTAPLAGGSGIGISASGSGIQQNSIGKTSDENYGFFVEKSESEFPISEFRYIMYVGLSITTQCQETTCHKGPPKIIKDTLYSTGFTRGLCGVDCCVVG